MTRDLRPLLPATLCCATATLLAACSPQTGGTPSPTSAPTFASGSATSTAVTAPKVSSPKSLTGIDSCQLLTPPQLQTLGATAAPKTKKTPWGETECQWVNSDISVYVAPDTTQGKGLATVYGNSNTFSGFIPVQVAGYPAVSVNKQSRSCSVYVGSSDTQTFLVDFTRLGGQRADYQDPCGFAQTVAGAVLANLPAGK